MSLASKMKQEPHLVSHRRLSKEVPLEKESNTANTLLFLFPLLKTTLAHQAAREERQQGKKSRKTGEMCPGQGEGWRNVLRRSQQTGSGNIGM